MRSKELSRSYLGNPVTTKIRQRRRHEAAGPSNIPSSTLDRSGSSAHLSGGATPTPQPSNYPDFFKVGIDESGNHDSARLRRRLGRKSGPAARQSSRRPPGNTTRQHTRNIAKIYGSPCSAPRTHRDDNVPPNNTMLLVRRPHQKQQGLRLILPQRSTRLRPSLAYMTRRAGTTLAATSQATFHPTRTR